MRREIFNDLKKINDESKRLAEYRTWAIFGLIVFVGTISFASDNMWKIASAIFASILGLMYFSQNRRSSNVSIDEDKRKLFGLSKDLAPANLNGSSLRNLPETKEYQDRPVGPRFKNLVQIPSVPTRSFEGSGVPRQYKDVMSPDNYKRPDIETFVSQQVTASPEVSRSQPQEFQGFSPIATPRRRRSGSGSFGNENMFRQQQNLTPSSNNKQGTPAKVSFQEAMNSMSSTLATTMNSTPKGTTAVYRPSPIDSPMNLMMRNTTSNSRSGINKLSPTPTVTRITKSYYSATNDVGAEISATNWLGITEVPDEWSESFRFVLGRHLHDQLSLFDDVVEEMFTQLTLKAATGQAGGISHSDLLKAQRLLELTDERLQLDNGTFVEADEVLDLCKRIGMNPTLIHRYELCLTLFHMPRILEEPLASNINAAAGGLFMNQQSPSLSSARKNHDAVIFLKRLRDLASSCPDGRLRIAWDRSAPISVSKYAGRFLSPASHESYNNKKGAEGLSDQDIVMLLLLHKCDFNNTIWNKSIDTQHRFSAKHFVNNGSDIQQIVKSYFAPCTSQVQLQQQIALMPKAILYRSTLPTGAPSNHFNVYCLSPYAEIIQVDEGRNNCFDSVVLFLLAIYKALAIEHFGKNDNSVGLNSHGLFALGTSGGINVSVVKDLLQDILNTKEEIGEYLTSTYGLKFVQ